MSKENIILCNNTVNAKIRDMTGKTTLIISFNTVLKALIGHGGQKKGHTQKRHKTTSRTNKFSKVKKIECQYIKITNVFLHSGK